MIQLSSFEKSLPELHQEILVVEFRESDVNLMNFDKPLSVNVGSFQKRVHMDNSHYIDYDENGYAEIEPTLFWCPVDNLSKLFKVT